MRYGAFVFEQVQAIFDVLRTKVVPFGKPGGETNIAIGMAIKFRAVARGDNDRFAHMAHLAQFTQCIDKLSTRKNNFFADLNRSGAVIYAEYEE